MMRVVLAVMLFIPTIESNTQCMRWWLVEEASAPGPNWGQSLEYHGGQRVSLLFDGLFGPAGRETWLWNGERWMQEFGTQPNSGGLHAMAYDSRRAVVVLFGGISTGPFAELDETWEWDGASWQRPAIVARPPRRAEHAMAYDPKRGVTVLFGGRDSDNEITYGDTWEYDGQRWTQVATSGPVPRHMHAMVYDAARGETMLFGGFTDAPGTLDDTWIWDGKLWTQQAVSGPVASGGHALTYDSRRQVCVLSRFGSLGNETWEWDGKTWTRLMIPGPSRRNDMAMTYDSHRGRIVLFASQTQFTTLADTWEFGLYPDCDHSTGAGVVDIFDFLCFGNKFANNDPYACNCDLSTGNNVCDIFDFLCFENLFAQCQP